MSTEHAALARSPFPPTIAPEQMKIGQQYLLAVRQSSMETEVFGPFTIMERPRRQGDILKPSHFIVPVFLVNECRRHPREEYLLPISGHSTVLGKKMSLHSYSESVKDYFENCNKNPGSPLCQEI